MSLLNVVTVIALVLTVLNWVVFVIGSLPSKAPKGQAAPLESYEKHGLDPSEVMDGAGKLAGAFKKAGTASTAAAMSLVCLLIAAIAAGINKV